jgi:GT2 family glycosyltransferase
MDTHDVIVCVHNGREDTIKCLESVVAHKSSSITGEIIVIDDASEKETQSAINKFAAKHIGIRIHRLNQQSFYTKAANTGLLQSTAKYRTLLNSDTLVTAGWQEKTLSVFKSCNLIGIVGPLSNAASTQSIPYYKSQSNQTAINLLPTGVKPDDIADFLMNSLVEYAPPFVPLIHGFCFTINSEVINKIGLLDEDLFPNGYGEENDYCFRADDAGFILAVAINTFIYHKKSVSYNNSAEREKYMNDGMSALIRKYGTKRISDAVEYMESNPSLMKVRCLVLDKWRDYYSL